tara:strand:- start:76 stop:417 length:342 start_codon:yes stop_codon:yes gene_type:complete
MELSMFNDKHEYVTFLNKKERESYWVGKLVKAKVPIKVNLFDEIPIDTLGLVLGVKRPVVGMDYLLDVRWMTGERETCYQYDIFSYNACTHFINREVTCVKQKPIEKKVYKNT